MPKNQQTKNTYFLFENHPLCGFSFDFLPEGHRVPLFPFSIGRWCAYYQQSVVSSTTEEF
jgi:hypothetical protein